MKSRSEHILKERHAGARSYRRSLTLALQVCMNASPASSTLKVTLKRQLFSITVFFWAKKCFFEMNLIRS